LSFLPTKILKGRKVKAAEYETDHSRKILTKLLNSDYSKEKSWKDIKNYQAFNKLLCWSLDILCEVEIKFTYIVLQGTAQPASIRTRKRRLSNGCQKILEYLFESGQLPEIPWIEILLQPMFSKNKVQKSYIINKSLWHMRERPAQMILSGGTFHAREHEEKCMILCLNNVGLQKSHPEILDMTTWEWKFGGTLFKNI
jgi:hypothetical protein